jgi:hypothetical protein
MNVLQHLVRVRAQHSEALPAGFVAQRLRQMTLIHPNKLPHFMTTFRFPQPSPSSILAIRSSA